MPVKMGKPLSLTEKQLDVMAQITELDIEKSKLLVKEADEDVAQLLDAPVLEDLEDNA